MKLPQEEMKEFFCRRASKRGRAEAGHSFKGEMNPARQTTVESSILAEKTVYGKNLNT